MFVENLTAVAVCIMDGGMKELSAVAEQMAAHAGRLTLYARQWLDAGLAQDVVQGALVSLLSQRSCPDDPLAWMYVAVRNGAIDALRSAERRRRRERSVVEQSNGWFEPSPGAGLDAEAARLAVERLPRELREIVVLRIWGELGFAQIARITQVSVGTAHQRYTEAMEQLRQVL